MLQDRKGFIWFTSGSGLYRYDGHASMHFKNLPDVARSLPSNIVTSLFEDEHANLWVGTANGLVRFNPETGDFTDFSPASGPEKFRSVRRIVSDHRGGMWVGTWGGLQHLNPQTGELRQYVHDSQRPGSLANNNINALAVDKSGGVWLGLWQTGLDYLPPGESAFKHFPRIDTPQKPDPLLNTTRALLLDRKDRLWMGTEGGVVVWNTATQWASREKLSGMPEFDHVRVSSILEDKDGAIWVGSLTAGLARWDDDNKSLLVYPVNEADPSSLSSRNVRSLMQDSQGILWIGGAQIARLNLASQGFARYLPKGLSAEINTSRALALEDDMHLWVGAQDGLHLMDLTTQKVVQSFRAEPNRQGALGSNTIYSLYRPPGGPLWVGTMNGLYRYEKRTGTFQHTEFGKGSINYINMIRPGSGGTLWLVTGDGVMHYHPQTGAVQRFVHDPQDARSRSITSATDVLEDSKGRVWMVDINGGGLDMLDVSIGKFQNYRSNSSNGVGLSDDKGNRLHEDQQGNLWIATPNGLNRGTLQPDGSLQLRSYGKGSERPFTSIYSIEHDTAGKIWFTTDVGISRFDPDSEKFDNYTVSDGVTEGFGLCLSIADEKGALYFASMSGISAVTPQAVRVNLALPPLAITDISIFNTSIRNALPGEQVKLEGNTFDPKALKLSWRESVFAIEFSALQFDAQELMRYAYRLEGFDREWVETDASHRIATYTNLDPGDYVFRVKAANSKGVWNETGITLPITITPPFWLTWWFRLTGVVMLVVGTVMLYRLRIHRLLKQEELLVALVAQRTTELEDANNRLANLSMTDGLTGIPNRRRFDEVLANEWNRAKRNHQPIAVAMLDVDWFKKYNDHYGHQVGDECLRQVAQAFADKVQRAGDLAARYGGEEFVLVVPGSDSATVLNMAKAICHAIERLALPHALSPFGQVTVSIGVASVIPEDNGSPDQLLKNADDALYRAKEQGRNRAIVL